MLSPGSIALVPFPFSDLKSSKKRPVLALTSPDGNGDFIALAVTSKGYHAGAIELNQDSMQSGVLPCRSWVRTDKVFTLSRHLAAKTVGQTARTVTEQAISGLCAALGDKES